MVTPRFLNSSELTRPTSCSDLPLVLEGKGARSFRDLCVFVTAERERLRHDMLTYGGVLLRGFELRDAEHFKEIVLALGYELECENPMDTSPRSNFADRVFTSTDTPDCYPILAHNENSFLNQRPGMIAFFCLIAPLRFGETPLFDSRAAARALDSKVRTKLFEKKVCYRRRLPKWRRGWASEINRTWMEAFGTEDRDSIEEAVRKSGMSCQWHENGRILHTENVVDPLPIHPETGDQCLNLQAFHKTNILLDLDEVKPRQNRLYNAFLKFGVSTLYAMDAMPLSITYGDGSPISRDEMEEIRRATWDNSVIFSWRNGDLLVLDNILTGHGRMNVQRPRKILTAFADLVAFPVEYGERQSA